VDNIEQFLDLPRLTTTLIEFLPRLGMAVVIMTAFWVLYRISRIPLVAALNRSGIDETLVSLMVGKLYRYVLLLVGMVMAADQLGVNIGAALAGMGVAGIAVGFAAQDSVANVISGILIFWDKPFVVGDWIKTEGEYGKVSNITLRTTRIRTPRNTYVVIPNKRIIDAVLENYSKHGQLRVDVPLGIAYKEDIRKAREVLLNAMRSLGSPVKMDPAPDVVVTELGGSSVDLNVRVWLDHAKDQQGAFARVLEACKLALDEAGIQIPFPHLQLFVDNVEEPVWKGAAQLVGAARPRGSA
jgi:small conductance mechanosensitive channel